jgi:hypothetical protein
MQGDFRAHKILYHAERHSPWLYIFSCYLLTVQPFTVMRRPWFAWQGVVLPQKGTCGHIKDLVSTEDCAKYETVGDFRARKSGLPRTEMGTSAHEIGGLPRTYLKIYTRHQDIYRIRVCGNPGNVEESRVVSRILCKRASPSLEGFDFKLLVPARFVRASAW